MEADWGVTLAIDDPVIVVPWSATVEDSSRCRFVDLRQGLERIDEIDEARRSPELRAALIALNGSDSPWWTAKCDVWNSSVEQGDEAADPYEMEAEPAETAFVAGSYIDLLSRDTRLLNHFEDCERWIRRVVGELRSLAARAARVDLILRHASVDGAPGFAVTWFVVGCGRTAELAEQHWRSALARALTVMVSRHALDSNRSPTL